MKKLTYLFAAIMATILSCNSQVDPVEALFEKYEGKEGINCIAISNFGLGIFDEMEIELDDDLKLEKFSKIRILSIDDENRYPDVNFYNELKSYIEHGDFKEMMRVKESGQEMKILVREVNRKICEMLLISGGNENVLISMKSE